ncbi:MAG: hypothetical protein ACKO6N_19780 [Myxococcota bacterium]
MRNALRFMLLILGYLTCAGLLIAPVWMDAMPRIIGGGELGGWLWRFWWMKMEIVALGQKFADQPLNQLLHVLSLGRFPETGNVTDLLLMTIPLDLLLGHPEHYNWKVALIIFSNGLAGYALCRYLTGRVGVAFIGGLTLCCNALMVYEFVSSGLRQTILCFLTLFILWLERLLREKTRRAALCMGFFFGLTAAFYWFYGLFAAMYGVLRLLYAWGVERERPTRTLLLQLVQGGAVAVVLILPFMAPYLLMPGSGELPEVSWFKSFPSLEALQNAPLRPDTRYENLLASLARVLSSSWTVDWVFNPFEIRNNPLSMALVALGIGVFRWRKVGFWLLIFTLFYTLTWGPYLQYQGEFIRLGGEYAVRLPYWFAFKLIPMMSRLFAPYRMASMVVIALMVLAALNMAWVASKLERQAWARWGLGILFVSLYFGQFMLDPLQIRKIGSNRMLPLSASEVSVPAWYYELAKEKGRLGIVELPLERQQDLLNYYQVVHSKKVLGGWADPGALPPELRFDRQPNKVTALLQWLSRPDGMERNAFAQALRMLNQSPYMMGSYTPQDVTHLHSFGYRYVVLHELGCYLLEPRWGKELYARMKEQLTQALGKPLREDLEHPLAASSDELLRYHNGMTWMVSLYSPLLIPEPRPIPLHMVVYAIPEVAPERPTSPELSAPVLSLPTLEGDKPQPPPEAKGTAPAGAPVLTDEPPKKGESSSPRPSVPLEPPPSTPSL